MDRTAIVENVQVRVREVDDGPARHVPDTGTPNGPFLGDDPIEDACTGRHFMQVKRDLSGDEIERLAYPVAGYAPANRKKRCRQRVDFAADLISTGFRG